MNTIKLVISADDEINGLRLACSQFIDQTEDHYTTVCGMLVGHVVEQNPTSITNLVNSLIAHFQSIGLGQAHDILDWCLRLFGKISMQTMHSHILKGITTVYLMETRPHLIVGVVCYYEGGGTPA